MRDLGFEGYAIDFVECPDGLKTFLRGELQMHRVVCKFSLFSVPQFMCSFQAVSLRANIDIQKAMDYVSRPVGSFPGGANFITGMVQHQVTRSRYGRNARSDATSNISQARNLTAQTGTSFSFRSDRLKTDSAQLTTNKRSGWKVSCSNLKLNLKHTTKRNKS